MQVIIYLGDGQPYCCHTGTPFSPILLTNNLIYLQQTNKYHNVPVKRYLGEGLHNLEICVLLDPSFDRLSNLAICLRQQKCPIFLLWHCKYFAEITTSFYLRRNLYIRKL
jgi:hypothetical protein